MNSQANIAEQDFMACVGAWSRDRLLDLPDVLGGMKKTDYWKLAKGQHKKNASEKVVWQLLDGALTCGKHPAGA
jgi:hypothetical protein